MEHKQALNEVSKYIAQSKELISQYLIHNEMEYDEYLSEAVKLLNIALDNVVI